MKRYKSIIFLLFIILYILTGCSTPIEETAVESSSSMAVPAGETFVEVAKASTSNLAGTWEGLLKVQPGVELKLLFTIEKSAEGYTSTLTIPQQGVTGLPVTSTTLDANDKVEFLISTIGVRFTGTFNFNEPGTRIEGTFEQSGFKFPLVLSPSRQTTSTGRPQDPIPPYPYISEEVEFIQQPEGFSLAGTITRPIVAGKHPAVVLVTGSGLQDRDEAIMGHRPFLVLADALTKAGIVVLRYDDRGFAKSKGDATEATTVDFAMDAASAVSYLARQTYVDSAKVGIIGHSEGGVIAPIVASKTLEVGFIVLMAGTGVNGIEVLKDQTAALLRAQGTPDGYIEQIVALNDSIYQIIIDPNRDLEDRKHTVADKLASLGMGTDEINSQLAALFSPWYRYFLTLDPAGYLEKTSVPVLVLNGTKDTQVTSALNVPAIEEALKRGGNTQSTTIVYDGLNHLFQPAQTGAIAEYASIDITIDPRVLNDIATWILQKK
jgi:uncharacterized protein